MLRLVLVVIALVVISLLTFTFITTQAISEEMELVNLNPSFEQDFTGWRPYVQAPASATFHIDKDAAEGGRCVRIEIDKVTENIWDVGLRQDALSLRAGKVYTVDFLAKADIRKTIGIEIKRSPALGPWEGIMPIRRISITEEWAEYSVNFIPAKDYDQGAACLRLWIGQAIGDVWIDGVRLYLGEKQWRKGWQPPKSVEAAGKLRGTWGLLKHNSR